MERKEDCFLGGSLPHWRGCSIHSNPIPFLIIERRPVSGEEGEEPRSLGRCR